MTSGTHLVADVLERTAQRDDQRHSAVADAPDTRSETASRQRIRSTGGTYLLADGGEARNRRPTVNPATSGTNPVADALEPSSASGRQAQLSSSRMRLNDQRELGPATQPETPRVIADALETHGDTTPRRRYELAPRPEGTTTRTEGQTPRRGSESHVPDANGGRTSHCPRATIPAA
jgi:hypothetical protein